MNVEFGELFGDVEHGIHVAETGRKNDIVMLTGHVLDDALGVLPSGTLSTYEVVTPGRELRNLRA